MTLREAKRYKANWFATYVGITDWHQRIEIDAYRRMLVRTPAGREQRFTATTYRRTRGYNTPLQGVAAELMLPVLNRLPSTTADLDARLVAVVHDEIVLEAKTADVLSTKKVLEETMVAGMLDIFPGATTTVLVEVRAGKSWADKKG